MAAAQAGASATSFPLPMGSLTPDEVHFIPQQQRQWGPRASAETLQNGSGMQSWSRSMCWRRRHAPWSLPPTPHHQRGFMALQELGPCPLTCCWPQLDTDPTPRLLRSVFGSSLHWCTPSQRYQSWQCRAGMRRLDKCCFTAKEGCQHVFPRTFPGQAEDATSAFPESHNRKSGRSKSICKSISRCASHQCSCILPSLEFKDKASWVSRTGDSL